MPSSGDVLPSRLSMEPNIGTIHRALTRAEVVQAGRLPQPVYRQGGQGDLAVQVERLISPESVHVPTSPPAKGGLSRPRIYTAEHSGNQQGKPNIPVLTRCSAE